jgi:hypothetical protein
MSFSTTFVLSPDMQLSSSTSSGLPSAPSLTSLSEGDEAFWASKEARPWTWPSLPDSTSERAFPFLFRALLNQLDAHLPLSHDLTLAGVFGPAPMQRSNGRGDSLHSRHAP